MTTFKKSTLKWTKGTVDIRSSLNPAEPRKPKAGYVGKDQAIFAIYKTPDRWIVTHRQSGMGAAFCYHMSVAKQIASDLLSLDLSWETDEYGRFVNNNEDYTVVQNIRKAGIYYPESKGKNVENYCAYRDRFKMVLIIQ